MGKEKWRKILIYLWNSLNREMFSTTILKLKYYRTLRFEDLDHKGVGMWKRERVLKKCSVYTQKNADLGLKTGHRPGKVKGLIKRPCP